MREEWRQGEKSETGSRKERQGERKREGRKIEVRREWRNAMREKERSQWVEGQIDEQNNYQNDW